MLHSPAANETKKSTKGQTKPEQKIILYRLIVPEGTINNNTEIEWSSPKCLSFPILFESVATLFFTVSVVWSDPTERLVFTLGITINPDMTALSLPETTSTHRGPASQAGKQHRGKERISHRHRAKHQLPSIRPPSSCTTEPTSNERFSGISNSPTDADETHSPCGWSDYCLSSTHPTSVWWCAAQQRSRPTKSGMFNAWVWLRPINVSRFSTQLYQHRCVSIQSSRVRLSLLPLTLRCHPLLNSHKRTVGSRQLSHSTTAKPAQRL